LKRITLLTKMSSRPEHQAPPEIFYNETEARKYTSNSRMIEIQSSMTERALELLALPEGEVGGKKLILDLGCGSGLSGEVVENHGHLWMGIDISPHMLEVAKEREVEGDIFLADMGDGLFFKPGTFDGAISVSAIQWLCNADKKYHEPRRRLNKFFQSLYNCLARGARAVLQFYPEDPAQMEMITGAAMRCGFSGGLVVDYPNSSKAKKFFLCLFAGMPVGGYQLPKALGEDGMEEEDDDSKEQTSVKYSKERHQNHVRKNKRDPVKSKNWVLKKKETQRKKGLEVRPDSKFTARKRSGFRQ